MVKSCAALGCTYDWSSGKTDDANISFHKFPLRHPDLLEVWTSRIGRSAFIPTEHSRLCSRHFQRSDFNNPDAPKHRRLRDDAIPSLNLPNFPTGEGVGASLSEDPRLHATMAPAERNNFPNTMAAHLPAAPANVCNAAHSNAESTPRDSLDWLNNNSRNTFSDVENSQAEEHNDLWPPTLQPQHPQHSQHQQHQQHLQSQQQPVMHEDAVEALVEKQLDASRRSMQARHSPNILSTDSQSSDEEEQPPSKKQCLGSLQIDCDIDALDMQQAMRQGLAANVGSFQSSTPIPKGNLSANLTRDSRALLQSKMKKKKSPGGKPMGSVEKSAVQYTAWESLWSNIGSAVRIVAEAMAFFLLTKADIAREQHQMQMEQCRRSLQQTPCTACPTTYREWDSASEVNSTQESESEAGEVENLLEQRNCLKAEPDDTPRE